MISRIIVVLALFLCTNVPAETLTAEEAKTISLMAQKMQNTRTYTYKEDKKEDYYIQYFYQRLNKDGTVYSRRESISKKDNSRLSSNVNNKDGTFEYTEMGGGQTMQFMYKVNVALTNNDYHNEHGSFSGVSGDYMGIPCYIITRKAFPDNFSYRMFEKCYRTNESENDFKKFYRSLFPAMQINYIGRQDKFIYKTVSYNPDGKLFGLREFNPAFLNLDPDIPDHIFELTSAESSNLKTVNNIAQRMDTFDETLSKEGRITAKQKKQQSSPGYIIKSVKTITAGIDDNFSTITSVLSTILFWLAIGLFGLAAFYKWKKCKL